MKTNFFVNKAVLGAITSNPLEIDVDLALTSITRLIKEEAISPHTVQEVTAVLLTKELNLTGLQHQRLTRLNIESSIHISMNSRPALKHISKLTTKREISEYFALKGLSFTGDILAFIGKLRDRNLSISVDFNSYISVVSFTIQSELLVLESTKNTNSLLICPYA